MEWVFIHTGDFFFFFFFKQRELKNKRAEAPSIFFVLFSIGKYKGWGGGVVCDDLNQL